MRKFKRDWDPDERGPAPFLAKTIEVLTKLAPPDPEALNEVPETRLQDCAMSAMLAALAAHELAQHWFEFGKMAQAMADLAERIRGEAGSEATKKALADFEAEFGERLRDIGGE